MAAYACKEEHAEAVFRNCVRAWGRTLFKGAVKLDPFCSANTCTLWS